MSQMKEIDLKERLKHYENTYFRFREKQDPSGKWKLGWLADHEYNSRSDIPCSLTIEGKNMVFNFANLELDTSFPESGLYQCEDYGRIPLLVTRSPQRQWRWGMYKGNTHIEVVLYSNPMMRTVYQYIDRKYLFSGLPSGFCALTLDFSVAHSIMFPKTVTFDVGVKELTSNIPKGPCAIINNDFMLTISPIHEGLLLWRWDIPVAKVYTTREGHLLQSMSMIFRQEVIDFISRNGVTNATIS